MLNISTN